MYRMRKCPVCRKKINIKAKQGACSVFCKLTSNYGVYTSDGLILSKAGQRKYEQITGKKYENRENKA